MLSWEFSNDMAAEGGTGGKSEVRIEVGTRVSAHVCVLNAVSLRVFLVQQIAVVTRQIKTLGGFRGSCRGPA